jgi:tetratricopeptide (TPR) repeat protein
MADKKIPPGDADLEKETKLFQEAQVYPLDGEGRKEQARKYDPPLAVKTPAAPAGESRGGGRLQEGIRLFRMKRYDMALKELLQVNGGGDNADLAYYLGLCYTKLGNYEDALLYLDQVIAGGQNILRSYQCRMTLAYIYVITKKTKMAEFELARLQKSGFESVQL